MRKVLESFTPKPQKYFTVEAVNHINAEGEAEWVGLGVGSAPVEETRFYARSVAKRAARAYANKNNVETRVVEYS